MIKSRLDLYRPTDDIIEEDPAYQGFPDVSLQPDFNVPISRPSKPVDKVNRAIKDVGKMLYGQPGGAPDLADFFQGTARMIEPIQKAITPEDPKNLIGVELEEAMKKKARGRIAPQVGTGRFAEQEIAKRVEEDIGGTQFSPFKAGLQKVLGPELETVQEVAAGKPLYELSPIQLTDFIFAGLNVLDVAGVTTLVGKLAARGASAGARDLVNSLQGLNKQEATQVLSRANPRFVREIQESIVDGGRTTERLTDQDLATAQMQAAEERGMRFLTGKPDARQSKENIEKIKQTKIKRTEENLYEPYRKDFGDYLSQTKVPSAKGFYEYLTKNNIPLTLEKLNVPGKKVRYKKPSERKAANKNISTETEHLKKAVNYLTDNQSPLGPYREEWTKVAEEILENSNTPLANSQILQKLRQQGIELEGNAIQKINEFIKKPYLSNKAKKNTLKGRDALETENRLALKKELDAFVQDLKNNPDKQNLGIENYMITRTRGTSAGPARLRTILADYRGGREGVSQPGRRSEKGGDIITPEFVEEIRELTKIKLEPRDQGFRQYVPTPTKVADITVEGIAGKAALPRAQQKLNDLYRTNFVLNDPKTGKNIYDFTDLEGFEKTASAYGINRVPAGDPNASVLHKQNHEQIMRLAKDIEILQKGYLSPAQRQGYIDVINESRQLTEYTKPKFREIIMANPDLRDQLIKEYTEYYTKFPKTVERGGKKIKIPVEEMTLDDFIEEGSKAFEGHVSHLFRIEDFMTNNKGMMGMGDVSNLVRTNMGVENIAFQNRGENVIDNAVADIRKKLNKNEIPFKGMRALVAINNILSRKGMGAYRRLNKKNLTPEVIRFINGQFNDRVSGTIAKRQGDDPEVFQKFNDIFLGSEQPLTFAQQKARFDQLMDYFVKNPKSLKVYKGEKPKRKNIMIEGYEETPYVRRGFIDTMIAEIIDNTNFNKGGAVRMAIGGDPLQNINQQQFAPDPAFQGEDFFQEAVDSGNLTAFNPLRLFNTFGKVKGTPTKSDIGQPTTLPRADQAVPVLEESDFPFKSFTYEKLQSPNAPGAARPQDWANYLTGGDTAPISEIRDSGLEQFLRDYEKYYPGRKLSKQQIVDYFETSPTGNLEMRVKQEVNPDFPDQGRTRHMNAGSQPLDNQGVNYREVIVQAGPIPGEGQPFVNSSHFSEPNVIAFTRVADYPLADGSTAAVIQELQTDMLNTVRVEQLRIKTLLDRLKLTDQKARDILNNPASSPDQIRQAQQTIDALAQQVSPEQRALLEQTQGIKPFPNAAGASLIPGYTDEILKLQDNVNELLAQKKAANQPFIDENIFEINQRQLQLRDQLLDLNRSLEIDQNLKGIQVPNADQANELRSLSQRPIENFSYERTNDIQLFPPVPFKKTADYVDLIIKATIKDAQSRGINRVGIFTGELVNRRWGKDPTGPAGKKFNDLYSKVSVQQMNNIAKKYGGEVIEGAIVDPSKAQKGLKMTGKNVDGQFELLRDIAPTNREGVDEFLNDEILRIVEDYGPNDVVVRREIAPGQTMEFFASKQDEGLQLTPLGDADRAENATIIIEEYNPSLVKIPVLVLEEAEKAKGPFFLYRKKDGGKIASDGLVSITDIYGDY